MTGVSRDWLELPSDPLQAALVLRLRAVEDGGLTDVARALLTIRGVSIEGEAGKKRVINARRQLLGWRRGANPDVRLSTVTELAAALDENPVRVLAYQSKKLAAVADAAKLAAKPGGR